MNIPLSPPFYLASLGLIIFNILPYRLEIDFAAIVSFIDWSIFFLLLFNSAFEKVAFPHRSCLLVSYDTSFS